MHSTSLNQCLQSENVSQSCAVVMVSNRCKPWQAQSCNGCANNMPFTKAVQYLHTRCCLTIRPEAAYFQSGQPLFMVSRLNSAGDMPPDKLHNSWIYEIRGFIHWTMTDAYTSSRLHKLALQKGTATCCRKAPAPYMRRLQHNCKSLQLRHFVWSHQETRQTLRQWGNAAACVPTPLSPMGLQLLQGSNHLVKEHHAAQGLSWFSGCNCNERHSSLIDCTGCSVSFSYAGRDKQAQLLHALSPSDRLSCGLGQEPQVRSGTPAITSCQWRFIDNLPQRMLTGCWMTSNRSSASGPPE